MAGLFFFGAEVKQGTPAKTIPPEEVVLHVSQLTLAAGAKEDEHYRIFAEVHDVDVDADEDEKEAPEESKPQKFAIGTLVGHRQESLHVDLNFAGESVTFHVEGGSVPVHVTGYYNVVDTGADEDDMTDEEFMQQFGMTAEDAEDDEEFQPSEDELNSSKEYHLDSDAEEADENGMAVDASPQKPKKEAKQEQPKKDVKQEKKGGQKRPRDTEAAPSPGAKEEKQPKKQKKEQASPAASPAKPKEEKATPAKQGGNTPTKQGGKKNKKNNKKGGKGKQNN